MKCDELLLEDYVVYENEAAQDSYVQLGLFSDNDAEAARYQREQTAEIRERALQTAILRMQSRYGKNAVLKGMNFQAGATTIARNGQVGGHKA